jgi:hypothetical protein
VTKGRGRLIATKLSNLDRQFLPEFVQFGCMHHVIAAEALRSAYERADETAGRVREQVERTDATTATTMAKSLNDGARVQTAVVARLLNEFASAVEDLGAMMLAIRKRARRGLMVEYLDAEVAGASDMLDQLMARGDAAFAELLNLPDLASLAGSIDPEALGAVTHDYSNLGETLVQIGSQYRDRGPQGVMVEPGKVPSDRVAIVLGVLGSDGQWPERKGGLLAQAHNKIKHRFAVIEDIEALGLEAGGQILYTHYPRDQAAVVRLVHNITQVALAGAELGALMLMLDRASTDPG